MSTLVSAVRQVYFGVLYVASVGDVVLWTEGQNVYNDSVISGLAPYFIHIIYAIWTPHSSLLRAATANHPMVAPWISYCNTPPTHRPRNVKSVDSSFRTSQ